MIAIGQGHSLFNAVHRDGRNDRAKISSRTLHMLLLQSVKTVGATKYTLSPRPSGRLPQVISRAPSSFPMRM